MTDSAPRILAYIPVIHRGVVAWLSRYPEAEILVLGKTVTEEFRPLQKDIRALSAVEIVESLQALKLGKTVSLIEKANLSQLTGQVIMADEELSHTLAQTVLSHCDVTFDPIWLRWEKDSITGERVVQPDLQWQKTQLAAALETTTNPDLRFLLTAKLEATQSADWWRQVGAVVVKEGRILLQAHNKHFPSEQQPYIDGDPRTASHQGEDLELSTALHAEAGLITEAAKQGLSLAGSTIYVTTFPCPTCAKLLANTGVKTLIYQAGYSVLHGEEILKAAGVELIHLESDS